MVSMVRDNLYIQMVEYHCGGLNSKALMCLNSEPIEIGTIRRHDY